jgi:hypothetical protein
MIHFLGLTPLCSSTQHTLLFFCREDLNGVWPPVDFMGGVTLDQIEARIKVVISIIYA